MRDLSHPHRSDGQPGGDLTGQIQRRRTFAIISHPDAGKTTLTERLLYLGGAVHLAGAVKAGKRARHATSDWMELEKQRGISVTSSVMQFTCRGRVINLLDTPGHADFSEDTYRTLTAVDSALMVIDIAKGVEQRTRKLMEVCRLRDTPVMTFINKMDSEGRDPVEVMDEIERVLNIRCAPMTWPIGGGRDFAGVYRLYDGVVRLFGGRGGRAANGGNAAERCIKGLDSNEAEAALGERAAALRDEVALLQGAGHQFDRADYRAGALTPVLFGSALGGGGVDELLETFVEIAPPPDCRARPTQTREVAATEPKFTGFVFKIQANMDPAHHDRMAFLRVTSGRFDQGMKMRHIRTGKSMAVRGARTFMAERREQAASACAGDILGLPNHGTIRIGDTFSEGEALKFTGIPNFAPELFRRIRLDEPLRAKALHRGVAQLSEEGAAQVFRPLAGNDLILGAVGILQFDVVAHRLRHEYSVACAFEAVAVSTARWVVFADPETERDFRRRNQPHLAVDNLGALTYLAPNRANLQLTEARWPGIEFRMTREF